MTALPQGEPGAGTGEYTLAQPSTTSHVPYLKPVPVTVRAGQLSSIVLDFDTGIR